MDHHPEAGAGRERTCDADVVVVGARCAGAATAMLLADAGHDVLLLDVEAPTESLEVIFRAFFLSSSTTVVTARSMPRFKSIGFMPAATALAPSLTIA